jgi:hypothetical protein
VTGTDQTIQDSSNAIFPAIGLVECNDVGHVWTRVKVDSPVLLTVALQADGFALVHV